MFAPSFILQQSWCSQETWAKVRVNSGRLGWAHVNDNSSFDYEKGRSEKRDVEEGPGGSRGSKG